MEKPKKLKFGDTIGLIAPSSPTSTFERVEMAKEKIIQMGFKVKMGKSPYERYGYLSGTDKIRAEDINNMFADPEVNGIICLRGGYGTPRILDLIDYEIIRKNPKVFLGYSDITALHIVFNQIANLVTFHGPMVSSDMLGEFSEFTKNSVFKTLMDSEVIGLIENPLGYEIETLQGGKAEGTAIGGNLSLISSTIGTAFEIDTKGKILFIEEIGEEPYRIDRMLNQLRLAGKLNDAIGIIFGDFNNCVPSDLNQSLGLEEVINDFIRPLKIPIISNFRAGHCEPQITIPFGIKISLDADNKKIRVLEGAVR